MTERPRLVAGTSGDERLAATRPGAGTDWHLPAHMRDARGVRARQAAQVASGADVLLAQTYLTHRRALARVGEARRAREATFAAIAVARSAIAEGLEGRDVPRSEAPPALAADGSPAPPGHLPNDRPVLVAGVLPWIGDDPGSGRLGPIDAALARDCEDQADLLAEAGADLILIEDMPGPREAVAAMAAARATGLPTWAELRPLWLDAFATPLPELVLWRVDPTREGGRPGPWVGEVGTAFGAMFPRPASVDPGAPAPLDGGSPSVPVTATGLWLEAGARVIGISDGADPASLAALRDAIDRHMLARDASRQDEDAPWRAWIAAGAALAPAGAALWLGSVEEDRLPAGFDWTIVPLSELAHLPDRAFRLVVEAEVVPGVPLAAQLLDERGVIVARRARDAARPDDLEILDLDDTAGRSWLIARRRSGS